jgi:hypothetical protein
MSITTHISDIEQSIKPSSLIPTRIFIIPYRDRERDKHIFTNHMTSLLENDESNINTYEFYFSHQYDKRPFNRGAMKNIGFLAIKNKYPENYKDITFIFHDIDTLPAEKGLIDYNTTHGIVKHYYGYKFALGGIFSIKGADFEKSNGFPNFWGWGLEDNTINDRCLEAGLIIDRSQFYEIHDKRILRTFDGWQRTISRRDSLIYKNKEYDSILDLKNIKWIINNEYINVTQFNCKMNPDIQLYAPIDIRTTHKLIIPKETQVRRDWSMFKR